MIGLLAELTSWVIVAIRIFMGTCERDAKVGDGRDRRVQ